MSFKTSRIAQTSKDLIKFVEKHVFIYGHDPTQLKRVFKACLLTSTCFAFSCIDPINSNMGVSSYLCSLISVSMHPGRRLGAMMQSLVLGLAGVAIGLPYTLFVHFIAKKVYSDEKDLQNVYGLFIVFDFFVLAMAGYVRSAAPRFFIFTFVVFLISHFSFLLPITTSLENLAHDFSVPLLIGIGLSFVINITIFPEFGSTYIGTTILSAVHELQVMFSNTSYFFVNLDVDAPNMAKDYADKVAFLISQKKKVRGCFAQCVATMLECSYEFSYSYMAPQELKPLLKHLRSLNITTNALHVACELVLGVFVGQSQNSGPYEFEFSDLEKKIEEDLQKFDDEDFSESEEDVFKDSKDLLKRLKPHKEMDFSDRSMLLEFIHSIKEPVQDVTKVALNAVNQIKCVIAYTYDVGVEKVKFSALNDVTFVSLDEESRKLKYQLTINQIDEYLMQLARVNQSFGTIVKRELSKISDQDVDYIYLVPREEYFVMSLYILNFREASIIISKILSEARTLLEIRMRREAKGWSGRHVWFSNITKKKDWLKFLRTGSGDVQEGESASIIAIKQDNEDFNTKDDGVKRSSYGRLNRSNLSIFSEKRKKITLRMSINNLKTKIRRALNSGLKFLSKRKIHIESAFRTTLVLMLLSFPGYSTGMHAWFTDVRGSWAGFAAFASLETNIGSTSVAAIYRIACVVVGSTWGLTLYVAGDYSADRYLMVAMIFMGAIPLYYFMLYSPYGRAGMMGVVSMCIVPLSTLRNQGIAGTIFSNYGKRCVTIIIGGSAATLVNAIIFPQKARVILVDQIICALKYCQLIQLQLAIGLTTQAYQIPSMVKNEKLFDKYHKKARAALLTAESLISVAKQEPRLKGSFDMHAEIYGEIIFVLNQILDRSNNIKFLRQQYGSAVLDELRPHTYIYRREVTGSIVSLLRTVEQALFSKDPIPQYLPSPRISHIRVINAVRQQLFIKAEEGVPNNQEENQDLDKEYVTSDRFDQSYKESRTENHMLRNEYMGWSASSGCSEEIIEYIEELVDLAKFLVGVQQFQFGFLARPLYKVWKSNVREEFRKEVENLHLREKQPFSTDNINQQPSNQPAVNLNGNDLRNGESNIDTPENFIPAISNISETLENNSLMYFPRASSDRLHLPGHISGTTTPHRTASPLRDLGFHSPAGLPTPGMGVIPLTSKMDQSSFHINHNEEATSHLDIPISSSTSIHRDSFGFGGTMDPLNGGMLERKATLTFPKDYKKKREHMDKKIGGGEPDKTASASDLALAHSTTTDDEHMRSRFSGFFHFGGHRSSTSLEENELDKRNKDYLHRNHVGSSVNHVDVKEEGGNDFDNVVQFPVKHETPIQIDDSFNIGTKRRPSRFTDTKAANTATPINHSTDIGTPLPQPAPKIPSRPITASSSSSRIPNLSKIASNRSSTSHKSQSSGTKRNDVTDNDLLSQLPLTLQRITTRRGRGISFGSGITKTVSGMSTHSTKSTKGK